jgi:hypothetical protein
MLVPKVDFSDTENVLRRGCFVTSCEFSLKFPNPPGLQYVIVIKKGYMLSKMVVPKNSKKTPTKVPKPTEDPESAANRIALLVKAADAEKAEELAARVDAERSAELLRVEEQKRQQSQDDRRQSNPSQAGEVTFASVMTHAKADATQFTPEQQEMFIRSSLLPDDSLVSGGKWPGHRR